MFYITLVLAGGLGVLMRYLLSRGVVVMQWTALPFGTMIANLLGCFLIGYLSWVLVHKLRVTADVQVFVLTGFLGGFTTFSAFSLETITLFEQGFSVRAFVYIVTSVALCIAMTLLGLSLARHT